VSAPGPLRLSRRALTYYWRTNLAVVLGIATAVAVLAGALIVGDTVRGSLRDLVTHRLGRVDHVVQSSGFFREALGKEFDGKIEGINLSETAIDVGETGKLFLGLALSGERYERRSNLCIARCVGHHLGEQRRRLGLRQVLARDQPVEQRSNHWSSKDSGNS